KQGRGGGRSDGAKCRRRPGIVRFPPTGAVQGQAEYIVTFRFSSGIGGKLGPALIDNKGGYPFASGKRTLRKVAKTRRDATRIAAVIDDVQRLPRHCMRLRNDGLRRRG